MARLVERVAGEYGRLPVLSAGLASTVALIFAFMVALYYNRVQLESLRAKATHTTPDHVEWGPPWIWPVTIVVIILVVGVYAWAYLLVAKEKAEEAAREREVFESAADRLREKMELPSLVDFNRVLLDKYHGIATEQATKAYRSSRFAMGIGLSILVVAFFAGWRLNAQGDRLFVGTVAGIGTAFTAYLSRTYMQTYERALQQLNQYFNQPVLNGYFLTAERIADSLPPENRVAMLEQVVADVLESGKEMHRNATGVGQSTASRPGRRGRTASAEPQVPAQQSQ